MQEGGVSLWRCQREEGNKFLHARRIAPGRSCNNSNLDVWPGLFPVAVAFDVGLASASLARMAFIFLVLLAPAFFFRFF
jgi:hypothetical protein